MKPSMYMFFLVIHFVHAGPLEITPDDILYADDLPAFKQLWDSIAFDLYKTQVRHRDRSSSDAEYWHKIEKVKIFQWAPLMLEEATKIGSKKIARFLRRYHIRALNNNYGEEITEDSDDEKTQVKVMVPRPVRQRNAN